MIELKNVTFTYPKQTQPVFSDFTVTIPSGARQCLWGISGLGKTTLLRLILGLEKPQSGTVIHDECGFAVVFQEDRLMPTETILENVALFSDEVTAKKILTELGLEKYLEERPAALSGGMKRRVALARALAHPASAIILDEPMTGLDEETARQTIDVINRYTKDKTLLLVTHDPDDAKKMNAVRISI